MSQILILILFILFMFGLIAFSFMQRYIKVPPNKMLIVYGKTAQNPDERFVIHTQGSHFVWPVIQEYTFLDITLRNLKAEVKAQDSQNKPISCRFLIDYKISSKAEIATKYVDLYGVSKEDNSERLIQDKVSRILKASFHTQEKNQILENPLRVEDDLKQKLSNELAILGLDLIGLSDFQVR